MALTRTEVLKKSASAATYNMILQLFLKMSSFLLNMIVLRHTSKDMLGVVNIKLFLLYTTVLFLTTEPFDLAALSKVEGKNWTQTINLMWLPVPLSVIFSIVCSVIWLYVWEVPDPEVIPHYYIGVICYAVAPVINNLARPNFIAALSFFFVKLRVVTVAFSESFKCLVVVVLLLWKPDLGIISFAVGQVLGEILYVCIYYTFFYLYIKTDDKSDQNFAYKTTRDFFPRVESDKPYINDQMALLTKSFFKQSILKISLTEGEKYVMTIFGVLSLGDQGVYGTINNLGALIPRFVFHPIEESGRIFFSQLLHRGQKYKDQPKNEAYLAYEVLRHLLRSMFLIGCVILVFGNSYSYLLLDLYGGKILSEGSGPFVLKWFCVYVLIIAVNGIMECFHFALMDEAETNSYNKKMLLFSMVSLGSSLILPYYLGGVGFIFANSLTMLTRIFHSFLFIKQYYNGTELRPLQSLIPSIPLIVSLVFSSIIMKISEVNFCCDLGWTFRFIHIAIGGTCLLVVLAVIYFTEAELKEFILKNYRKPKTQKSE